MTIVLTKFLSVIMAVLAFFCNTFGTMSAKLNPTSVPEGAIAIKYGNGNCENMNIFLPDDPSDAPAVLFTIHGGAWMMDDESDFNDYCAEAAEQGFIAVTVDYDKIQNGLTAFDMVDEISDAIDMVKTYLTEQGISADKIILAGHSAGAHLMLMYGFNHYNDCPFDIAFMVSNCAPVEFVGDSDAKTTTMGQFASTCVTFLSGTVAIDLHKESNEATIKSISPLYMVTADVPPTIVVQGNADEMVPYQNGVDLYDALCSCGVDSTFITYEGAGHFLGDSFTEGNAQRTAAFNEFVGKYCA